jgi:hypothetical protein
MRRFWAAARSVNRRSKEDCALLTAATTLVVSPSFSNFANACRISSLSADFAGTVAVSSLSTTAI